MLTRDYIIIIFQYNLILGTASVPVLSDAALAGVPDSDSPIIGARVSALKVMQL